MARPNDAVAELLQEYADLLAITGGEPFKVRVYEKAARSIDGYATDVSTMDPGELTHIPNVGSAIAEKITEFLARGSVAVIEERRSRIPAGVRELTAVPGLGPRRAMALHTELNVSSMEELELAIHDGRLRQLRGFGRRSEENLRRGIELSRGGVGRFLISEAMAVAEEIVKELSGHPDCLRCECAGSLRRMRETIGDVDILAASEHPRALMAAFVRHPAVTEILAHGDTKSSVRGHGGIQIDLRVVPQRSWGAALQYSTGSKAHNIRIRGLAIHKGLRLSEYGLFRSKDDTLVVSRTEEEVYARLGLPWIDPTLREDRGEIEAALADALPRVVTVGDIRGDLHTHTSLTDGVADLADMVDAARARGYRYMAVTDHAKDMPMQRMTEAKVLAQRDAIRALGRHGGLTVLHGTELNIGPQGTVDWGDDLLAGFDLCVASVHSHFTQSAAEMTRRLIRVCHNPYVTIMGHPTTRQIGHRAPVEADWDAVFSAAAATGTALEINSYPDRLDLPDELVLRARRAGVRFAVDTDAHATTHLDLLRFGVGTAARGWLTPDDVINTWPLARLRSFIAAKRRQPSPSPSR